MTVSRGEIYYAGMPNHPQHRPAVILTANWLSRHSPDVMVVPITSVERPPFPTRVELKPGEGGLKLRSWAKCDQVTTVPKALFSEGPVGRLGPERIRQIEEAVRLALDFA
jgi:mRNA-degrading endonuclease toxin of MazEF toxin-antitoxin module